MNTDHHSADAAKWRNAWCDVHSAIAHLNSGRGYFVTLNTRDFQRRDRELRNIGLVAVGPNEAVQLLLEGNNR